MKGTHTHTHIYMALCGDVVSARMPRASAFTWQKWRKRGKRERKGRIREVQGPRCTQVNAQIVYTRSRSRSGSMDSESIPDKEKNKRLAGSLSTRVITEMAQIVSR
jgi:hypothetical protein